MYAGSKPKRREIVSIVSFVILFCSTALFAVNDPPYLKILKDLHDADNGKVMVASHRGEHNHNPENSIASIQAAIDMGVDIVEIDVRETKDGYIVLMHDETIDRTTNGTGLVSHMTLAELKKYRLKMPDGSLSDLQVPTLKEAMLLAKGKCLINLDKSEPLLEECSRVLDETGTAGQAILKGGGNPYKVQQSLDWIDSDAHYIPVVSIKYTSQEKRVFAKYKKNIEVLSPEAVEIVFYYENCSLIGKESLELVKKKDIRLWCNSLFEEHGAGHVDRKALKDPDANWGWLIRHGISIIQTDEPQALLDYLRSEKLHD